MKIWLDDIRPMPFPERIAEGKFGYPFDPEAPYDIWCKTAKEAIKLIEGGAVKFISFDHDLGDMEGEDGLWYTKYEHAPTGYDVAKKIEEWAWHGQLGPIRWKVHSANPVGSENIRKAMLSAERAWKERYNV